MNEVIPIICSNFSVGSCFLENVILWKIPYKNVNRVTRDGTLYLEDGTRYIVVPIYNAKEKLAGLKIKKAYQEIGVSCENLAHQFYENPVDIEYF